MAPSAKPLGTAVTVVVHGCWYSTSVLLMRSRYCAVAGGALLMVIAGDTPSPHRFFEPIVVATPSRGSSGKGGGGEAQPASRPTRSNASGARARPRIAFTFPMYLFYLAAPATQQPNFSQPMTPRTR